MTRFLEATRERFLLAIAASLPAERFIELHFFPAIRQGGVESGVAVIAAHPERVEEAVLADAPEAPDVILRSESDPSRHSERSEESAFATGEEIGSARDERARLQIDGSAFATGEEIGSARDERARLQIDGSALSEAKSRSFASLRMTPERYTVYTAKYKLVLKGADRGKWECSVVAEADAPLVTVETVVRGVQRRSSEVEEAERMSGDDARDYVLAATR